MKSLRSLALGVAALAFSASSVFAVSETFSTPGSVAGWTVFANGAQDVLANVGEALSLGGNDYSFFYAIAAAEASGGIFTGDYSGYGQLSLDVNLSGGSVVDRLSVSLANFTTGHEWTYEFSFVTGAVNSLVAPLGAAGAGWTQQSGPSADFSELLGSVEEFSVLFSYDGTPSPASGFAATLDNVTLTAIPEPSAAPALAGLLIAGLVALRRRRA